jgi:hypothetical protein
VRLSRCEVRDHINYRKNDRWRSYRFYRALQRLKSPMRYICEIFGAPRFSSFSTQSAQSGRWWQEDLVYINRRGGPRARTMGDRAPASALWSSYRENCHRRPGSGSLLSA